MEFNEYRKVEIGQELLEQGLSAFILIFHFLCEVKDLLIDLESILAARARLRTSQLENERRFNENSDLAHGGDDL